MKNKNTQYGFILDFLKQFGIVFTMAVLAMSVAGILLERFSPDDIRELSSLFASEGGLSYGAVFQIMFFSITISLVSSFLFSEKRQYKLHFFIRTLLLLLAALLAISVLALIFNWFPPNSIETWTGFIICTILCFAVSVAFTLLRFKLEGKKYDKLLADFKVRNNS